MAAEITADGWPATAEGWAELATRPYQSGDGQNLWTSVPVNLRERVTTAIREMVAAEREACARCAEAAYPRQDSYAGDVRNPGEIIAAKIRARGQA